LEQVKNTLTGAELIDRINTLGRLAWQERRYNIPASFELSREALELSLNIQYKEGMAYAYRTMGVLHFLQMNYQKALPFLQKAKNIFLELLNHKCTASCFRYLGNIYALIGATEKAKTQYEIAIEYADKARDLKGATFVKVNMSQLFHLKGEYREALRQLNECVSVLERFDDRFALCETYFNIGNNHLQTGDFEKSEFYLNKALHLGTEIGYLKGIAQANTILGALFFRKNEPAPALNYMHEALASALELNEKRIASETYRALSEVYRYIGNYHKAFECLSQYEEMKAKLTANDNKSLLDSLLSEIEIEKSERLLLESKNREIEQAYQLIKDKNKDILDSIKYARHIQESLLPREELINKHFDQNFIFYQPRDIVSGDFYWCTEKDGLVYFAAVDCTGHGVPGAFISIVSSNCLYQALREVSYANAAELLDRVTILFHQMIRQTYEDSTVRDGMDISLCIFDMKNRTLSFAGANHDLHYVRNGEWNEIKGNKHAIAYFIGEEIKKFNENKLSLLPGDTIYLFSDGYADQFGGETRSKKYMRKRLKKLLLGLSDLPIHEQRVQLVKEFNIWKGSNEQIDDIMVVGFRV
jgi:serine phosphatase RsbU (regulator of sigma subunit)